MSARHCIVLAVDLETPGARECALDLMDAHKGPTSFELVAKELAVVFLYPGVR